MLLKMFHMNCGESILAYDNDECLLIDCGTQSKWEVSCFRIYAVNKELNKYAKKEAMITHFHKDHINGFMELISPFDTSMEPILFKKVYVPHIFTTNYHVNVVDALLLADFLEHRFVQSGSLRITIFELVQKMINNTTSLELLSRGSEFSTCNSENKVLWPIPLYKQYFPEISRFLNQCTPEFRNALYHLSDSISRLYINYAAGMETSLLSNTMEAIPVEIRIVEHLLDNMFPNGREVNLNWSFEGKTKDFSLIAEKVIEEAKINDNNTSIVFHTIRNDGINFLMTGDIGKKVLNKIVKNKIPANDTDLRIKSRYVAVKAPHHGTESHYCDKLFGHESKIRMAIVLISNGNYGGTGEVCHKYLQNPKYNVVLTEDRLKEDKYYNTPNPIVIDDTYI